VGICTLPNEWYFLVGPVPQGPVSRREILALMHEGQIGPQTLLWQDSWPEWLPLEQTAILPTPPPAPAHRYTTPPPPPGERSRQATRPRPTLPGPLIAGAMILALLLGMSLQWLFSNLFAHREIARQPEPPSPVVDSNHPTPLSIPTSSLPANNLGSPLSSDASLHLDERPGQTEKPSVPGNALTATPARQPPEATFVPDAPTDRLLPGVKLISSDSTASDPAKPPETFPADKPMAIEPGKDYTVFQEVQIQRLPQFSIAGQVFGQDLRYKLLSEIQVSLPDERGRRTIDQVIVGTRLVNADEMSKSSLEKSLRELEGWQFSATMNSHGEVIEWEAGPKSGRSIVDVNPLDLRGFLVTHVMDEDGWKELTQLSFFRPDPAAVQDAPWKRQMTHDFGALGHWSGMTSYQRGKQKEGFTLYHYVHELEYFSPTDPSSDLPFKMVDVELVPKAAEGRIYYDEATDRVAGVEETFVVQGNLKVEFLGQLNDLGISEQQAMVVMLTPENPWHELK
jgi:hypothetical protein